MRLSRSSLSRGGHAATAADAMWAVPIASTGGAFHCGSGNILCSPETCPGPSDRFVTLRLVPFAAQYLAERVPLEKVYSLEPVYHEKTVSVQRNACAPATKSLWEYHVQVGLGGDGAAGMGVTLQDDFRWSAFGICESYAKRHRLMTHGGRLDTQAAAHAILR